MEWFTVLGKRYDDIDVMFDWRGGFRVNNAKNVCVYVLFDNIIMKTNNFLKSFLLKIITHKCRLHNPILKIYLFVWVEQYLQIMKLYIEIDTQLHKKDLHEYS